MRIAEIGAYEEAASLVKGFYRRGVATNNFLGERDYRKSIESRSLCYAAWKDGLAFFRGEEGFARMNFYLGEAPGEEELPLDVPVVTEIPLRPGDPNGERALRFWRERGFVPILERVRLKLDSPGDLSPKEKWIPRRAVDQELPAVLAFLKEFFPPLTGCLPDVEDLGASTVLILGDESGMPEGVLHASPGMGSFEIRHLAVKPELRGTGAAQSLVGAYLTECPARIHRVWTGKDNAAALRFYEKCGYLPDGWTSCVLLLEGRKK